MIERSFDEMIAYFNRRVAGMDINQDYKMELLGMVTALGVKHEKSAPQWIPCSERLPCEDGRYLVFYWLMKDMPWISVMYYGKPTFPEKDHSCFYVSDGEYGDVEYDDIVAWMPLPEPYKGVTE